MIWVVRGHVWVEVVVVGGGGGREGGGFGCLLIEKIDLYMV